MGARATVAALALVALAGCGDSPTAPKATSQLAGFTLRAEGSSGVPIGGGATARVKVVSLWTFEESTYAFVTDWPGPREARTSLPDGTAPYWAAGNYWVECDPGHERSCVLVIERLEGEAWSWQEAGMRPLASDVWMADVVIGDRVVRMGPVVYEIVAAE